MREKKMNHLILGAVFWVTGESWGTDGRLALPGTWPPAAGEKPKKCVISLAGGRGEGDARPRARARAAVRYTMGAVNLPGVVALLE